MGGSKRPQTNSCSNLVSLCAQCHREVESDRQQALIDGFLVPQVGDPRTFSVRHGRLGHVYLDDLGGMETL